MDANVLGLKIVRIKEGYQELLDINGDPSWAKKIWDIRRDLPAGTNTAEGKTVLLLLGAESGTILTIAACIDGRQDDCISAWIFVPSKADVSAKQLVEIIDETKKELVANQRDDTKLRQLFEKKYPLCDAIRTPIVSSGEQYAFRKYGRGSMYQLYELLKNPYQADYNPFKGVFFIDSTAGLTCEGMDLTSRPLRASVKIKPVSPVHGFVAFIGATPIDKSFFLPEGDEVVITWKRSGYKSIVKKWTVREGQSLPGINESDYMVLVKYDWFTVKDKDTGEFIKHYTVKVNDAIISESYPLPVPEATISSCRVIVKASGYSVKSETCDLNSKKICFTLEKEILSYDFKIELLHDDNKYADLHVETRVKLDDRSPIAGYVIDRQNGHYLNYHPFGKKQVKFALIALLVALFVGMLGGVLLTNAFIKYSKKTEISAICGKNGGPSELNAEKGGSKKSNTDIEKIINYLDSHEKWNRTEMDGFKEIQGLWDALNECRFDEILKHKYLKELEGSKKFKELLRAIRKNVCHQSSKKYNNDGDYDITVEKYIKNLNKAKESSQSSDLSSSTTQGTGGTSDCESTNDNQDNY